MSTWSKEEAGGGSVNSTPTYTTTLTVNDILIGTDILGAKHIGITTDTNLMQLTNNIVNISGSMVSNNISTNGVTILTGGTLTVGTEGAANDDSKFWGASSSNHYMLWDVSESLLKIQSNDNSDMLQLVCSDADADNGPCLGLYRQSGSVAANDTIGKIKFAGFNSSSTNIDYATVRGQIINKDAGTEIGSMHLACMTESAGGNAVKTGLWLKGSAVNDNVNAFFNNGYVSAAGGIVMGGGVAGVHTKQVSSGTLALTSNQMGLVQITSESSTSDDVDIITVDGGTPPNGTVLMLRPTDTHTITIRTGSHSGVSDANTSVRFNVNAGDSSTPHQMTLATSIVLNTVVNVVTLVYSGGRWVVQGYDVHEIRTGE